MKVFSWKWQKSYNAFSWKMVCTFITYRTCWKIRVGDFYKGLFCILIFHFDLGRVKQVPTFIQKFDNQFRIIQRSKHTLALLSLVKKLHHIIMKRNEITFKASRLRRIWSHSQQSQMTNSFTFNCNLTELSCKSGIY